MFSIPIVLHLFFIFMPTIKRPEHRAFYSYHKLAGTTFPIYLLQPYSYRISCSMTIPDWNCISTLAGIMLIFFAVFAICSPS
jgi:hypothetical protein